MTNDEKRTDGDRRAALDARDWVVRLTSGNVSDADLARFDAWRSASPRHASAFERERAFWQDLRFLDDAGAAVPVAAVPRTRVRPGRRRVLMAGGAVLAAGIASVVAPRVLLWSRASFATGIGEQAEYALPDGSVAVLNTDSAIAVRFQPALRLVSLLKGEAEFRVKPDPAAPFRVAALGGNSDSTGGLFAVKAMADVATITGMQGVVRVSAPADRASGRVDLAAGQQTRYARDGTPHAARAIDIEVERSWRRGRVIFEAAPFAQAMVELGRYVPERIVMRSQDRDDVPVSAIVSTGQVFAGIQALAKTQGLSVRRVPGVVILIT